MTHGALGTVFTFILFGCIEQGRQDAEIFLAEKMEALAGQDVALPCALKIDNSVNIVMIEWSRKRNVNQKLALYSSVYGKTQFSPPNVTLTVNVSTMASHLHLHGVTKRDSGIYICSLSTFPLGSLRGETKLTVVDVAAGTEKGFPEPTSSRRTTSLTAQRSTVATQTTDVPTGATDGPKTSRGIVTAGGTTSPRTNEAQSKVTPGPATSPDLLGPSTHQGTRTTLIAFSDQSTASDASTSHRGSASASTAEAREDASPRTVQPEAEPTTRLEKPSTAGKITDHPGNTSASTVAPSTGDRGTDINEDGPPQNGLLLASTLVPALLLLAVVAFLWRKWRIKQRMDRPPPFKPPPPPVKYTAVRNREFSAQPFPDRVY